MAQVLQRDPTGLSLRADPSALAPERLLVFEVKGDVANFARAVSRVPGLELIDEEELPSDEDKAPFAYLLVPDLVALRQILSLWQTWLSVGELPDGYAPWRDVFGCLRDLRVWGPADRVQPLDVEILEEEIEGRDDEELVSLEFELIYRGAVAVGAAAESAVVQSIAQAGGNVIHRARIDDIAYHAVLARIPVASIRMLIARAPGSLAGVEPIMHIRPQSVVTGIEANDSIAPAAPVAERPVSEASILALLDGVPVAGHPLLRRHLNVEDHFGLEPDALVAQRVHGSAMASLIVHGDRNRPEPPLPRQIHCIPVMGSNDRFPPDRLIVDLIYQAVLKMRGGEQPSAPWVIIVNISLGNVRRPFHGQLSPWARLLDRLAYRFGLLFLVSAGNVTGNFPISAFHTRTAFEDATPAVRAEGVVNALAAVVADRRILSPSETINGLTIGGRNLDWVSQADRASARVNVDPFTDLDTANPSSALGPGFANSVKPDILMPAAREHLRVIGSGSGVIVSPTSPARGAGLKVAAPPRSGIEGAEAFTNGTSAATALASRTAHRIHDALEAAYGQEFLQLSGTHRAVLIKALLVHPARWPQEAATLVKRLLGPLGRGQAPRQKDNIRRFFGYGLYDADDAVACAADRATFWCVGDLGRERVVDVVVPIPSAISGQARPHSISATLAWFTPVLPGRKSYRSVRMKILEPGELDVLAVTGHGGQPDMNQTNRGTVYTRQWSGDRAAVVTEGMTVTLKIQRDPDPAAPVDEAVPFGLAVSLEMPGELRLYDQVRTRLQPRPPQRAMP
ncbi:MAG: S8 family peptidase [Mesorhizobium sp.]|nr:MAG: S8 family peptidase [Mesorhizobium sp.]RWK50079.1 MAG: S8 family peptidase [Mesorhizobium sp.]RWK86543.1 MAG: S8 family peptidase [Mesorhizobium sp.]RWK89524.1 MAG: S8 family peptidase [Mesorhizobium sp.]TIP54972.1 MAG: S8 family peptidase [Mesorhizobium sp.]